MDVNISSEFQKALHYEQQGDLASAKKCYENILAIDPKHELTLHGLGIIYAQSGDIKTAQSYFEMVLEVNPRSDSAYSNLGNCLICRFKSISKCTFLIMNVMDYRSVFT